VNALISRQVEWVTGAKIEVHEIVLSGGKTPVSKWFWKLPKDDQESFAARLERFIPWVSTKYFKSYDSLWQVATYDYRVLGFRADEFKLVLTNGFKKGRGSRETPPEQIEKCKQLKAEFLGN
jgi:hypothetical protein